MLRRIYYSTEKSDNKRADSRNADTRKKKKNKEEKQGNIRAFILYKDNHENKTEIIGEG